MIEKVVYTYWTNKGTNYLCGFPTTECFIEVFRKSLNKAQEFFPSVIIYTDVEGKAFLKAQSIKASFVVVDYDTYDFNHAYWNFPKLITYNLQEAPFLHVDMDFLMEEKPDGLDQPIVCERLRGLVLFSSQLTFLPEVIQANYTPNNICSGLLGGDPKIFKILYNISSELVKNKNQTVAFLNMFGIEEIVLSAICKKNSIEPYANTKKYIHYQGTASKQSLAAPTITENDLIIN